MSNRFIIFIMLFVVIFSVSFLDTSLQITAFGYDKEKMIGKDYDYNKDIQIKNNQLLSSNYRGYGYTLVSSPLIEDSQKIPKSNNLSTYSDNQNITIREYPVPQGSRPHDVAPATSMLYVTDNVSRNLLKDIVWYTAQASGELGKLNTTTGKTSHIFLGEGSAPHGVIAGPDGAPWITDGGLNAIVRVDPFTEDVTTYSLPQTVGYTNLNTATFDNNGTLWFTGQSGIYGRLFPSTGAMEIFDAPNGAGPYGITTTPNGSIYYASLAGSYVGLVDTKTGKVTVLEPPTADQGSRRVWSDSDGNIWVSEWNAGKLGMYDRQMDLWKEWKLPGDNPKPYAVYVDTDDKVWISDFGSNSMYRFDPLDESFDKFDIPSPGANVRQILGIEGEIWGAESGSDRLLLIKTINSRTTDG
ncbi:Vgb family protein [Candidatus Nitrosocosmicus sp. R]